MPDAEDFPGRPQLFPIFLDLRGRPCLVVGGGKEAVAKATALARSGAVVTMVAPDLEAGPLSASPIEGTTHQITCEQRSYTSGEAALYRLVVTATGRPEIDGMVAAEADLAGVWVNSVDDPEHCTFYVPSVHRDGSVAIAVSTGGSSPALASWLRDRAATASGTGLGQAAELLGAARAQLRRVGQSTLGVDWRSLLDGAFLELVREGELKRARALIDDVIADSLDRAPASE